MDEAELDVESELERQMLQGARRALAPTAADAQRVLAATQQALVGAAAASINVHAPARAPSSLAASAWKQLGAAVSIALVSGAVGYYFGLHAQPAEARRALSAPAVAGLKVQAASPRAEVTPAPALPTTAAAVAGSGARQVQDKPLAARGAARRAGGAGATAALQQAPLPAPSSTRSQEEITTMRRVERALREREPQRALSLLFELDRNVPIGKLMQERQAAFAIARCAARLGSAVQLAAEFASRYPNSPYIARVRDTCVAEEQQRNIAPPETHD